MIIGLCVVGLIYLIGIVIFTYEIKYAVVINPNEPFLRGDYNQYLGKTS